MQEILKKTAAEQSRMIANKEVSATELTKAALSRIDEVDDNRQKPQPQEK